MRVRLFAYRIFSLLIAASLVLSPVAPTAQATVPQAVSLRRVTQANSLRYGQETGPATPTAPDPSSPPPAAPTTSRLQQALREGKWPAQIASGAGNAQPSQHGPQRNDPAEGIPVHAYSPFDERANREHPCPPNGCNYEPGEVLVKLAPAIQPRSGQETGAWTSDAPLNRALAEQEIVQLIPLFPTAKAPRAGEVVVTADGDVLPLLGGLHVLATPGHTPDHFSFYSPTLGVLFAGDALNTRNGRLQATPPSITADPDAARRSALRLLALAPAVIACGHGKPFIGHSADDVMSLFNELRQE